MKTLPTFGKIYLLLIVLNSFFLTLKGLESANGYIISFMVTGGVLGLIISIGLYYLKNWARILLTFYTVILSIIFSGIYFLLVMNPFTSFYAKFPFVAPYFLSIMLIIFTTLYFNNRSVKQLFVRHVVSNNVYKAN